MIDKIKSPQYFSTLIKVAFIEKKTYMYPISPFIKKRATGNQRLKTSWLQHVRVNGKR